MGKSSAPPAPDYASAAKETAKGDKAAAEYQTFANRINQYTPYGSLTYDYSPQYNEDAYQKAVNDYQAKLANNTAQSSGRKGFGSIAMSGVANAVGSAPNREDFKTGGGWSQRMNLTPQAQATLDKQMALSDKYADVAGIGFDRTRDIFENPSLDQSQLPSRGIDIGKTAQEALLSRIEPNLMREDEALRTRLANQGIGLGSTAYNREMNLQGQKGTDLRLQAALQGINLDQENRAAALNEAYAAQSRPLDLINALRSGAQVQNPTFQGFAQQRATQGPDLLSAANQQYNAAVNAVNTDNANTSAMIGGAAGIGLGLAGLPGANGSMVQGFKGLFA